MKMTNHLIGVLFAVLVSTAFADDLCEGDAAARAKSNAKVKQAQELEKAGRMREAYATTTKINDDCASDLNALDALKKRTAKAIAVEEEGKSRFGEAFDWYRRAFSDQDASRMQRKLVETKPDDINTVSNAVSYFHDIQDGSGEKDMRAHALKNVEKNLAVEEKQFASVGKNSLTALGKARDWVYYAGTGEERVIARAEQRGDTLLAEESRTFLELARNYYNFAEKKDKLQKLRAKAHGLGDKAAAKGEIEVAVEFYHIAGDNEKAEALRERSEQQQARNEETRKKKFAKEQDDLEKELNLK
jgi:hypothetical protein